MKIILGILQALFYLPINLFVTAIAYGLFLRCFRCLRRLMDGYPDGYGGSRHQIIRLMVIIVLINPLYTLILQRCLVILGVYCG